MRENSLASFGVLSALAMIFSYVEFLLLPSFFVPGVKLGIANLVILVVLYVLGEREALFINITRIILSSLLFATTNALLYSLPAGILSLAMMIFAKKSSHFTPVGVSIMGAVCHIIVQFFVASFIVGTMSVLRLLPLAVVVSATMGMVLGLIACSVLNSVGKKLKKRG